MTKLLQTFALLLVLSGPAHANTAELALASAGADTLTTAVALSSGLVELNPLGPVGSLLVKGLAMGYARSQPEPEQARQYNLMSSVWSGAAVSNLCWISGAGPFCFLVGAAAGGWLWNRGENERAKALETTAPLAQSE
jgi:hypothetical protein